jgi:phosphatidylserine/phosphatidylglycerophosphate/cardiolipin synthase-like enzyme
VAWAVFLVAAVAFGILFIRRDTVEYYLDHKYRVEDPEFFPSAHALADPLPITGNKIELSHNGRMIFPAMLEAIRGAKESVNFEAFLFHSGDADSPGHWSEMHARLEGPIVGSLQATFQAHWFNETGETLSGSGEFPELPPAGNLRAQVVASSSFSVPPLSLVQAVAFAAAQKSIYITNAYGAPSSGQTRSLVAAVKRGVDVRLLLPGKHNDQPATKAAGRTAYG